MQRSWDGSLRGPVEAQDGHNSVQTVDEVSVVVEANGIEPYRPWQKTLVLL